MFLGALILASKYLNDSSLKNAHWALCTGVFGRRDVARIEREFLEVLDFELGVHPRHLNHEFWSLIEARAVSCPSSTSASSRRSISTGLGALNLMEFGGVPTVTVKGRLNKLSQTSKVLTVWLLGVGGGVTKLVESRGMKR